MDSCRFLEFDSEFFGKRIASVKDEFLDDRNIEDVVSYVKENKIDCLYLRIPFDNDVYIKTAEANGFSLVDSRIELSVKMKSPYVLDEDSSDLEYDFAKLEDMDKLGELAAMSYDDSRFFFDKNFDVDKSREMYRLWLEKSIKGILSDFVGVTRIQGEAVGFVTAKIDPETKLGSIGLVGVDPDFRGKKIGQRTLQFTLNEFFKRGCSEIIVPTQLRNIAAQRLYQKSGFMTKYVYLWYHLWSKTAD